MSIRPFSRVADRLFQGSFSESLRMALAASMLLVGNLLSETAALAADEKQAEVPVKRVVIFSSGVTYYEHNGKVDGDAQVNMQFKVRDINDLLKSMVLQDLGGGQISTVSYGSKDPITRTLKTFVIDLTSNPTLADLLEQVRGEKVELDAPTKITGTIVGIEKKKVRVGKDETIEVDFLTLLTDEGLRSISLEMVGRIKLVNPKLDAELRQALSMLAMSHSTDKKTVSLKFTGKGSRDVSIGYIQESPIWKTSYRLVLDDEEKPKLQGWAIVENTTESDWKDVNLALVSGRPISFTMDLYESLYITRPEVKLELYASLRPRTYDQDLANKEKDFAAAREEFGKSRSLQSREEAKYADALRRQSAPASKPGAAYAPPAMEAAEYLADATEKRKFNLDSVKSAAVAGDVGELFRYQIAAPVSLERGRSAMLPIVNQPVDGEKLSIYNASVHAKHPLNGLRFKNTTQLNLMQGPITVFDGGAYAGDAQIASLAPGTERLLSYAMDLDTEVAPTSKNEPERMIGVKLVKGVMTVDYKYTRTMSYVVKNSGKKEKKLLIEYPLDLSWKLIAPEKPAEKTRDLYRFAVNAEPGKPATLNIKEERDGAQTVYVTNLDSNSINIYLNSKVVSDKVKAALQEVIKQKTAIQVAANARAELQRQSQVIEQEQARIRQNMKQLDKDTDLYRRYVTKFTAQEDQIDQLRDKITASLAAEQKLRQMLDAYLARLDLS